MGLRYEAWTVPWDTSGFKRRVAMVPDVEGSGSGSIPFLSMPGDSSVNVSVATFNRLEEIVSDTTSSLIRVFDCLPDGTNLVIDEYVTERAPQHHQEDRQATISGWGLLGALDRALVFAFDYPKSPTIQADHIWGASEDSDNGGLVGDGGFEEFPFPNGGFEEGNTSYWQGTANDGDLIGQGNLAAINSSVDAQAGDWYGLVTPLEQGGGIRRSISELVPGDDYTIDGFINEFTGAGDRIRVGIIGAASASHSNAYEEGDIWWADIGNAPEGTGASTGAYQQTTVTFQPEGDTVELVMMSDETTLNTFGVDGWTITGNNVGFAGWTPHKVGALSSVALAVHSTLHPHTGNGAILLQGTDGPNIDPFGRVGYGTIGVYKNIQAVVGQLYTMTAWVYHDGSGDNGANELFRIILNRRTPRGALSETITGDFAPAPGSYYMADATVSVPENTYTKIQMTVIADVTELRAEVRYAGTNLTTNVGTFESPNFWIDDISIHEGLPATTIGDIWQRLMDDCAVNHASLGRSVLAWVDYSSFDAVNDSNGNPWNQVIPFVARWGSFMGHVLDDTLNYGYEVELVPKDTPTGTPPDQKTHDLRIYNPGGRDDAPSGVGLGSHQPILGGEGYRRTPKYTAALVASSNGGFLEDTDASALANFGRLEVFQQDHEASGPVSRQLLADNLFAFEAANRTALQYKLVETPQGPRPFYQFRGGDTIAMSLAPSVAKSLRRVQRIDYVNTHPTQYSIVGSRVIKGEAAAYDLIRRMWRRMNRPDAIRRRATPSTEGTGEGAQATYTMALRGAHINSKGHAHVRLSDAASASQGQAELEAAITVVTSGGKIVLTDGELPVITHGNPVTVPDRVDIEGFGNGTTAIDIGDGIIDWTFQGRSNLRFLRMEITGGG